MYALLLKSPVSTDPPDPLMIHPLSIHLATLEAALLKPPVNPTLLHIATCRLSTRIRGVGPFRPRDFCLESRRTSWTSGTRLTELIISQEAGCGLGRNVLKFPTLITGPLHSPRASKTFGVRARVPSLVYWCCRHLATRFNSRIRNVLSALI